MYLNVKRTREKKKKDTSPTSINTNVSPDHWHNINTSRLTSFLSQHSSPLKLCNCTIDAPSSHERDLWRFHRLHITYQSQMKKF